MVRVRCQCGKSLKMPPEHVNKRATCPQCRARVRIVVAEKTAEEGKLKGRFTIKAAGQEAAELIFLGGRGPIEVGKAENAHLRLLAGGVSRRHCQLVQIERGWRVEDLGSTNGLYINNRRVKGHNLLHGDVLRVGDFELQYSYEPTKQADDAFKELAGDQSAADQPLITEDASALGFTFLDDTGVLKAPKPTKANPLTAAAAAAAGTAASAANRSSAPPLPPRDEDLFEFASDGDSGPPISLPVGAPRVTVSECPNCKQLVVPGARICIVCGTDLATGKTLRTDTGEERRATANPGSLSVFLRDCVRSFGFIANTGNLITFLILCVISCAQPIINYAGGCITLIASMIVQGWVASYLFNVILNAANGEEDLPDLTLTGGWMDDVIVPFFKFFATWVMALAPAIVYAVLVVAAGPQVIANPGPDFIAMVGLGVVLWPMIVLAAAVGGVTTMVRIDLMIATALRTPLAYLLVCVIAGLAFGASWFSQFILPRISGLGGNTLASTMVGIVIGTYFWIVAARSIGLYYHHFKGRFAWTWG